MIRLDSTLRKLRIVLNAATTTSALPIVVCWSDKTSAGYNGSATTSLSSGTTPVDIVAAPFASTVRDIDFISIFNADTVAATVSVIYSDNSVTSILTQMTLASGSTLKYTHAGGWQSTDKNGNQTASPSNLTGPISSLSGVTSITAQTGTGTTFVMNTSPTLITPVLGAATGTSVSLSGQYTSTLAAGTAPLVITSTTLVPNLYVARAVLADSATVNANLTGEVTSVGNATTLTNAAAIGKVITGYVSGAGVVAATDTILQAFQKLNGNDATNANLTGPITSVGNATAVAAQTGTGTTFVMNASPTLVTPAIGAASGVSLALSGALSVATTSTHTGFATFGSASAGAAQADVNGNVTAASWTTNGIGLATRANTYTDSSTLASGTAATNHIHTFAAPTLAASNTLVTTTNAATVYIAGAPTAGTNETITNPWALLVGAGNVGVGSASVIGWNSDTLLSRDGAGIIGQKNAANAQEYRVYGTTTGPKYLSLKHDGTNAIVGANSGAINFGTGASITPQVQVIDTASAVNFHQFTGSTTGNPINWAAAGTDANIAIRVAPKGTGNVLIDGGSSGVAQTLQIKNTGVNGAAIALFGDGGTTPNKTIRVTAGVFQILNNAFSLSILSITDAGALTVSNTLNMASYTVATLPTGVQGDNAYVTNALGPTYGAAVAGGGAVVNRVFKNATQWVCA